MEIGPQHARPDTPWARLEGAFLPALLLIKQPIEPRPCQTRAAEGCAHLIHRHVHNNRGQVQTLEAAVYKALRDIWKFFSLDPPSEVVQPKLSAISRGEIDDGAKPATTLLRAVFPEFSHRLIHRLAHSFPNANDAHKTVDNRHFRMTKSA
jgi:hypothetical protein